MPCPFHHSSPDTSLFSAPVYYCKCCMIERDSTIAHNYCHTSTFEQSSSCRKMFCDTLDGLLQDVQVVTSSLGRLLFFFAHFSSSGNSWCQLPCLLQFVAPSMIYFFLQIATMSYMLRCHFLHHKTFPCYFSDGLSIFEQNIVLNVTYSLSFDEKWLQKQIHYEHVDTI